MVIALLYLYQKHVHIIHIPKLQYSREYVQHQLKISTLLHTYATQPSHKGEIHNFHNKIVIRDRNKKKY